MAVDLKAAGMWNSVLIKTAHNEQPGVGMWALLVTVFEADGVTPLEIDVDATCNHAV